LKKSSVLSPNPINIFLAVRIFKGSIAKGNKNDGEILLYNTTNTIYSEGNLSELTYSASFALILISSEY
jgi:hypothetical protein